MRDGDNYMSAVGECGMQLAVFWSDTYMLRHSQILLSWRGNRSRFENGIDAESSQCPIQRSLQRPDGRTLLAVSVEPPVESKGDKIRTRCSTGMLYRM